MTKARTQNTAGFTLIEAIASITLLVFAVTGPMALSAQSLRVSRDARLHLEAVHLAEEGLEVVYNMRDNNSAGDTGTPPTSWKDDINSQCVSVPGGIQGCIVDVTEHTGAGVWKAGKALDGCNAAQCLDAAFLYKNNARGIYRQQRGGFGGGWTKTGYTRLVTVAVVVANRQERVTSTVTYTSYNGRVKTVSVSADIYDWFPCLLPICHP